MTAETAVLADLRAVLDLEALHEVCLGEFTPALGEQLVFGEGPAHARLLPIGSSGEAGSRDRPAIRRQCGEVVE